MGSTHGSLSSPSQTLRVRSSMVPITSCSDSSNISILRTRGGAIDDDPRPRRRDYERGDRPPPRPRRDDSREDPRRGGVPRPRDADRSFDGRSDRNRQFTDDMRRYDDRDRRMESNPRNNYQQRNSDPGGDGGKSKKWFSKKDKAKPPSSDIEQTDLGSQRNENVPPMPPPPPPPPPTDATTSTDINPAGTERTPIHYMFPTAEAAAEARIMSDNKLDDDNIAKDIGNEDMDAPDIPFLDVEEDDYAYRDYDRDGMDRRDRRRRYRDGDDEEERLRASPRRDAVTIFMSSKRGALQVRFGSAIVGAALGAFMGKVSNSCAVLWVTLNHTHVSCVFSYEIIKSAVTDERSIYDGSGCSLSFVCYWLPAK